MPLPSALSRLTLNQALALGAVVLGFFALGAHPYSGSTVTVDTRALALEVAREADHVEPLELADWIIQGRADYRLLDIRSAPEFAEYHIPTSESVPLPSLADAPIERRETILVYSEGGIHSAQAWMLLKARGFKAVYILRGGLDGWKDDVLFPVLAEHPSAYQARRDAKLKAVSARFGGAPQLPGAAAAGRPTARALPRVAVPVSPGPAGSAPARKKKKEGC